MHDFITYTVSCREFLNPTNSFNHKTILNKLTLALPQVLQMPNKLNESVRSLTRQQKQLLCLVKASLKTSAKIIILEFPEIEIQKTINLFIEQDLIEKTIIVIGTGIYEVTKKYDKISSQFLSLQVTVSLKYVIAS